VSRRLQSQPPRPLISRETLNTRHEVARARGWKEHPPSKAELAAAAALDNNLLRRPIVVRDGRAVVGRDEAGLRELLGGTR